MSPYLAWAPPGSGNGSDLPTALPAPSPLPSNHLPTAHATRAAPRTGLSWVSRPHAHRDPAPHSSSILAPPQIDPQAWVREPPEANPLHLASGNLPHLRLTTSATQGMSAGQRPILTDQDRPGQPRTICADSEAHSLSYIHCPLPQEPKGPGPRDGHTLPAPSPLASPQSPLWPLLPAQAARWVWPDKPASMSQTQRPVCLGMPTGASQGQA